MRKSSAPPQIREQHCMHYLLADLTLLVEAVVDLQQLHATFSLVLIFFFGFCPVFFSCHPLFPLHQSLKTHSPHQLPLLQQLGGHFLSGYYMYYLLLEEVVVFPASCLLPQSGHFLLQECPFRPLLLVNELFVFTNYNITLTYGARGLYFLSCLRNKLEEKHNRVAILGLTRCKLQPAKRTSCKTQTFFIPQDCLCYCARIIIIILLYLWKCCQNHISKRKGRNIILSKPQIVQGLTIIF